MPLKSDRERITGEKIPRLRPLAVNKPKLDSKQGESKIPTFGGKQCTTISRT